MKEVSDKNKKIAKYALNIFGGKPKVTTFWDEGNESSIDILQIQDSPSMGVISFSTIGLSDYITAKDKNDKSIGVEVVGACEKEYPLFANIMSSIAYYVINSKFSINPNSIFEDVISIYKEIETDMKHHYCPKVYHKYASFSTIPLSGISNRFVISKKTSILSCNAS